MTSSKADTARRAAIVSNAGRGTNAGAAGLRVDGPRGGPYDGAEPGGDLLMAHGTASQLVADFPDIAKPNEPLAPYTYFKLGGPAEVLVQPRSREELSEVIRSCFRRGIPLRVLGGGCNVLVRDEGVSGA